MYLSKCDIFRDRCTAWCCKQIAVITKIDNPDLVEYLTLHGIGIKDQVIIIPIKCKLLSDSNKCCRYSDRPKLCKEWTCKNPLNNLE